MDEKKIFAAKWAFNLLAPLLLYLVIPTSKTLTPPMLLFLVITFWAMGAWALGTLNEIAVGILLPAFYTVLCGVPQKVSYGPWTSDIPIIVIGGFILGRVMLETGLGKRIALWCIRIMGGSFIGALCGLTIAVIIVSPLVPSLLGKSAIFCVVAVSLCDALDFKPKSREASAVVLTACMAVASTKLWFLTSAADNVMAMRMADAVVGSTITWGEYAVQNVPTSLVYTAMTLGLILLLLPVRTDRATLRAIVERKYGELGPMTPEQKKTSVILILTILILSTENVHGLGIGFALIFIAMATFLPGVNLMNSERLSRTNFAPLFFIIGCMGIGSAGGYLKVTDWVAANAFPLFDGLRELGAGAGAYALGVTVNFLLTPLAAVSTLTSPLAELATHMHLNPRILVYSFMYGLDNYLFPYEYAVILYFFSSGYISFKSMLKVFAARIVCTGVFILFVAVPYWKLFSF